MGIHVEVSLNGIAKPLSYNRNVKVHLVVLAAAFLLLGGCRRDIQNTEAVRRSVIDYLSSRSGLDVSSMQVEVTSVTFRENEADATVSFRAKGSNNPAAGMQMAYTLERQGGKWVVKGRRGAGSGSDPHSGIGPDASTAGGTGDLPAGHPPIAPQSPNEQAQPKK